MFTAGQFEFLDDNTVFEYEPYHFKSDSLDKIHGFLYDDPKVRII